MLKRLLSRIGPWHRIAVLEGKVTKLQREVAAMQSVTIRVQLADLPEQQVRYG